MWSHPVAWSAALAPCSYALSVAYGELVDALPLVGLS